MATHHVDTEALDQAATWLLNHRQQIQSTTRAARIHAETVLQQAYQVPGTEQTYRRHLEAFTQQGTRMVQSLEAMVEYLRRVSQQYGGMGAAAGAQPMPGATGQTMGAMLPAAGYNHAHPHVGDDGVRAFVPVNPPRPPSRRRTSATTARPCSCQAGVPEVTGTHF